MSGPLIMTCQSWKLRAASNTVNLLLLIIMHTAVISLGPVTVSIVPAALHPQNKRVSADKVQPVQETVAPGLAWCPQPWVWHSSTWEALKVLQKLSPRPKPPELPGKEQRSQRRVLRQPWRKGLQQGRSACNSGSGPAGRGWRQAQSRSSICFK